MKRYIVRALSLAALLASALPRSFEAIASPFSAPPEGLAHPAIQQKWQRDEQEVNRGRGVWMWGPGPFYTNYEPYADTRQGNYLAQYFDKGRLEIADSDGDTRSPWFVTSGLLVKEMVSG